MRTDNEVLSLITDWADNNENTKIIIMTSSRTRENSQIDFLSDYDIEVYVDSLEEYKDDKWLNHFGKPMVKWPYYPKSTMDEVGITRLVLFEDGLRIDFQIMDQKDIDYKRYINGYKVLIDKDNKTLNIPEPTYDEFIIRKPSEKEYTSIVNEFWWDVYYVPKYIYRNQISFVKYMLDNILRFEYLHKVIDWYIGYNNDWKVETGIFGKYYQRYLSKEEWNQYLITFCGSNLDGNWNALLNMTDLFRTMAKKLSKELDYPYPDDVDKKVMDFCKQIINTRKS